MGLPEPFSGRAGADPELGITRGAEPDHLAEVEYPAEAERSEHDVVEGGTGGDVGALYGQMVDHPASLPDGQVARC